MFGVRFGAEMGDMAIIGRVCFVVGFLGPPGEAGPSESGHVESLKTI